MNYPGHETGLLTGDEHQQSALAAVNSSTNTQLVQSVTDGLVVRGMAGTLSELPIPLYNCIVSVGPLLSEMWKQ